MARYGVVRDGVLVEEREAEKGSPAHKMDSDSGPILRPIVDDGRPTYNHLTQRVEQSIVVERDRVRITYTVIAKSDAAIITAIKGEARNRILARMPEWKQANLTARSVELQDIWRRNGEWTVEEQAEADAILALWEWVKSIRAASDAIEAIKPLPADIDADERWPR